MMASDLSSGCTETIDILDDEKEEGEISLEDVSSSEEGGMGHLTSSYIIGKMRTCPDCKSWGECRTWCNATYHKSQGRRDPVKGKENRHHIREMGYAATKHTASTLQEKNDDLVPISSDSDMEIVGLTDTSNRKAKVKKKKGKKKYEPVPVTIDDLISPSTVDLMAIGPNISSMKIYREVVREVSPVHRPSVKSKMISRSPIRRYRSPIVTRSRSPLNNHSRSPILTKRNTPRKVRSPKRSLRRHSPVRATAKRPPLKLSTPPSKPSSSPSTRSYANRDGDVTRLLKKVRHLDSIGAHTSQPSVGRGKESSSLKEKLFSSNILKRSDSDDHAIHFKGKSKIKSETINDADDEDDLALLRQKALETKQKKSNRSSDHPADVESERRLAVNTDDDQDEEALQLRMIALRSAVMKKHQNRVRRGIKTKRSTRSESPFGTSFLDDIPVPCDELLKFASPPRTPSLDSNHIEDMDLDTDVEREKEKLPYSPTDKITENVPIDTALLGIEPSDVSFINVNETIGSPVFDDTQDELAASDSIMPYNYNNTYLPFQSLSNTPQYYAHSQYVSEIFHPDLNDATGKGLETPHGDGIVSGLIDGICYQEGTYSSTSMSDTPHPIPASKDLLASPVCSHATFASSFQMPQIAEQPPANNDGTVFLNVDTTFGNDMSVYETQTDAYSVAANAPTAIGYAESMSPNESMITIDDLPEPDADPLNPLAADDRNLPATEYIPEEAAAPCQAAAEETLREPLYMQGIPDVTKDTNKIPTLINRTLVPAPILKSNKRLRQCLKKRETAPEPTFKNAEMQPVTVTAADAASSSVFKPIKLQVAKKSASVLSTLATFDSSANESLDLVSEDQGDQGGSLEKENHEAAELRPPEIADTQGAASSSKASPATRAKKRKRTKRKSSARLLENATNPCSDAGVHRDAIADASTSDHVAIESGQSGSNGNAAQEGASTGESPRLQSVADTQEFVNSDDVTTEKRNTEENSRATPSTFVEYLQKESCHCLSTNSAATDHSESGIVDKVADTKHASRRQSVDEDEDELRAILLASLKRAKSTDANSPPAVPTVAPVVPTVAPVVPTVAPVAPITNSAATSVQSTAALKTAAGTMPSVANATCTTTANSNAPSLPAKPLTLSEAEKKKINDVSISVQSNGRKRGGSLDAAKSAPKKVPKKALTSTRVVNNAKKALTSTKVVNNAKKYQNMIVQRRLNLRKLDNAKPNEIVWPNVGGASKISPHASDTQRFVISLGSDSTDDSESEGERDVPAPAPVAEKPQAHQEVPADFEKNLNKFLREMRNEQEQSAAAAKSSGSSSGSQAAKRDVPQVDNGSSNVHTPLAVRHLPASQQEEYRRLKQQILEREKLKLQRKVASNNSHNGSGSNNKLSNAASSSEKSLLPCEKKAHVKPNQDKLKTPEINPQESSTEVGKKSDDATRGVSELNVCPVSADKNLSASVSKQTNVMQGKSGKKTIPNNLSIRITNVTAVSQPGGRTVENSREKQSARDKPQHRATLRTLSTDEINLKYMQVLLKQDTVERVVTINEKPVLQRDNTTASVDQGETLASVADVNQAEILNEKNLNNADGIDSSCFSNASTVKLSGNSSASRQEDTTMETTMTLSQYEAERQREIERDTSMSVLADNSDSSNSSPKSDTVADDNANPKDVWPALKKDVKAELNSLTSLPEVEQERYLRETEHKLVAKRYMVLDHLAEMSGNLRQWDMEKDVQTILAGEVRKLKEQLKVAEERLQQQRERVSSMGPKVSSARQKINTSQRECFKLSEVCSTLGNRLMGKNYKLPEAVTQLLNDKLKEVANHTRQFTKKKRLQSNDISENSYSSSLQEISDSSKDSEENLSLQEQSTNGAVVIDEAGSKTDTSRLTQSNQDKSLSISKTLDFSISENREETLANTPNHNEDITSLNRDSTLSSEPKLYQSSSTKQNDEHTGGSRTDESDPAVSSELKSATDSSSQKRNEQNNKKASTQLPSSSPSPSSSTTTITTDVTTMTTTTTKIAPYVSILMHLKKPRNINPHGILCPYEMQGICRDEDCQYIHQSRNQT